MIDFSEQQKNAQWLKERREMILAAHENACTQYVGIQRARQTAIKDHERKIRREKALAKKGARL